MAASLPLRSRARRWVAIARQAVVTAAMMTSYAGAQDGLDALLTPPAGNPRADGPRDARHPVPAPAATREAVAEIKDIFRADFAAATVPDRKASLARQLSLQAEKTAVVAERWALLGEAMRLASDAGDADLCFDLIGRTARDFDVDALNLKIDALSKLLVKADPAALDGLARTALALANAATEAGRPHSAAKCLSLASTLARKTRNRSLIAEITRAQQTTRDDERAAKELAAIQSKLTDNADDPQVCLEAGKYFCFRADDWARGLPLLAKGSDTDLARLAVAEANAPKTAAATIVLGDAWWEWAEQERGATKAAGMAHACNLYQAAIPSVQGLDRARLEKRVRDTQSKMDPTDTRVALADLQEAGVAGMPFPFSNDGTFGGKPFLCLGQVWPKGLQATAHPGGTSIRYKVPSNAKRLVGRAGVFGPQGAGDGMQPSAPLEFEVRLDGKTAWKSPPLPKRDDHVEFNILVFGATEIELRSSSKDPNSAWGAWLDPELILGK